MADGSSSGPLITVVIPAYNAERWVVSALTSVLSQDYRPFEVVVVDDGSKDGTGEAVRSFGGAVRYIRQENGGVCRARNRGASEGRGELLAFLDADDVWLPGKLTAQAGRLGRRADVVASFTATIAVDDTSGREEVLKYRIAVDPVADLLLHSAVIGNASSVMMRRSAFERVGGFDPDLSNCADWDMWVRLAGIGPLDLVETPLVRYRVHQGSMSTSVRLLEADTLRLLEKFFAVPENAARYGAIRRRVYANQYLVLSGSHLHAGNYGASLRFLAAAAVQRPAAILRALGMPARSAARLFGRLNGGGRR